MNFTRLVVALVVALIFSSNSGRAQEMQIQDFPLAITSFGAAVCDNHLYVLGGNAGQAHAINREGQNEIFRRIRLSENTEWETLGDAPPVQGNALVSHGGKLYRIGGLTAKNAPEEDQDLWSTSDFAEFDPATGAWTQLPDLPEPRSSFDAVVAGDAIYIVGGWTLRGKGTEAEWLDSAWRFDLSGDKQTWEPLPNPPHKRRAHALTQRNGKIYLLGGMQDRGGPTTSVLQLDTSTNQWSEGPTLPGDPMQGFGASAFNVGGEVIVSTANGQVLQLDSTGEQWKTIRRMDVTRFFHRLIGIDENHFLLIGGTNPTGKLASVVVFDRRKWNGDEPAGD